CQANLIARRALVRGARDEPPAVGRCPGFPTVRRESLTKGIVMAGTFLLVRGIKGKSRQEGYRDYLDVKTWKIGARLWVDEDSSKGSLTTGQSDLTDLTCTILCDTSVVRQFQSCLAGRHFTDARLIVTKDVSKAAGKTQAVEFLYLDMENVI